jgi:DNA-directed RNA polymerase specialized sigma24 family protein
VAEVGRNREAVVAEEPSALWPERLREVATVWVEARPGKSRDAHFVELWTLLEVGLLKYLRLAAWRSGRLDEDAIRDIASEKVLDLVGRIDRQEWRPAEVSAAQVCAYIAAAARNGAVDALRHRDRFEQEVDGKGRDLMPAEDPLAAAEFAERLRGCVIALTPRARLVWWLRTFHDLPARTVADHPGVRSTAGAVDVMFSRARDQVRTCLASAGLGTDRIPSGTFAALWDLIDRTRTMDRK